jgi:hypothetical protein
MMSSVKLMIKSSRTFRVAKENQLSIRKKHPRDFKKLKSSSSKNIRNLRQNLRSLASASLSKSNSCRRKTQN